MDSLLNSSRKVGSNFEAGVPMIPAPDESAAQRTKPAQARPVAPSARPKEGAKMTATGDVAR